MDCMEGMKLFPDKFFDLAVVDPPYGIGEANKNHASRNTPIKQKNGSTLKAPRTQYKRKAWDNNAPDQEYFNELRRVAKHLIIFGANHFIDRFPFDKNASGWIIWDKVNGDNDFADVEMAWTDFDMGAKLVRYMWNGFMQGKSLKEGHLQQGNKQLNEKRIHPTQKPVKLYEWIFANFTKPGQLILDTHLGSGSSRIAASKANLKFVGFETDEDYFNSHQTRWNRFNSQIRLL
ncbi:unnamed protein product [Ectocarpus fasciculatus]